MGRFALDLVAKHFPALPAPLPGVAWTVLLEQSDSEGEAQARHRDARPVIQKIDLSELAHDAVRLLSDEQRGDVSIAVVDSGLGLTPAQLGELEAGQHRAQSTGEVAQIGLPGQEHGAFLPRSDR